MTILLACVAAYSAACVVWHRRHERVRADASWLSDRRTLRELAGQPGPFTVRLARAVAPVG